VENWLERQSTRETVRNALRRLEPKSKTAIALYYLSEWPMQEIARFLNLSPAAVESRIRRARETLKRQLSGEFEPYFRMHRLDRSFEREVSERILRGAGHFYIPVLRRERVLDWFVRHFRLGVSRHGNLLVESGHELYLLESPTHSPGNLPLLAFEVADADELRLKLQRDGIEPGPIGTDDFLGKHFLFRDPDGNPYHAIEKKLSDGA